MKLTKEFKEKIKGDEKRHPLSILFGVSQSTLQRWTNLKKYEKLTTIKSIKILSEFTGLSQDQIFEEEND